jgi:hypothetical protein
MNPFSRREWKKVAKDAQKGKNDILWFVAGLIIIAAVILIFINP